MTHQRPRLLQLKILLRNIHPAVCRRVGLADDPSIVEPHWVIRFSRDGMTIVCTAFASTPRDYSIAYIGDRPAGRSGGGGGPHVYAERHRDAVGWTMADDVHTVVAVLRRASDGDAIDLNDPEERWKFEGVPPDGSTDCSRQ